MTLSDILHRKVAQHNDEWGAKKELLREEREREETHVNDTTSAARPMPEYLLRNPTSGAHDSAIIITFGTKRSTLLEPVVRGIPSMKDIMAA